METNPAYIRLSTVMNFIVKKEVGAILKGMNCMPDRIEAFLEAVAGSKEMEHELIELFFDIYSPEEANALADWMLTPLGQKHLATSLDLAHGGKDKP